MYSTVIVFILCNINLIYKTNLEHNNFVMKVGLSAGLGTAVIIMVIAVVLSCALIYFISKNRPLLKCEEYCFD